MKTILLLAASLSSLLSLPSFAAPSSNAWKEVAATNMDVAVLSKRGKEILDSGEWKWKHAQTDHFVVHYESGIFAAKVARMGEFFYDFISQDLKGATDRAKGRSHIFIFKNEKEWKTYQAHFAPAATEWAYSMVEGMVMYLQQAGDIQSSADVLGHEMTHLVVNRFLTGRPPTWLNEGVAQWYGEFAYAEFKGVKKSRKAQFRGLKNAYDLKELFSSETYPKGVLAIHYYYDTSKYLVAYLMLEHPVDKFLPFMDDVIAGKPVEGAIKEHYGFADVAALEEAFRKFCR